MRLFTLSKTSLFRALGIIGVLVLTLQLISSFTSFTNANAQTSAPTEPNCSNWSGSAAWNPFSLVTNRPNPDFSNNDCKDMPLLSYFPINTAQNNPRAKSYGAGELVTIHAYYNNGANPTSGSKIGSPNLGMSVKKTSDTTYVISSRLSGSVGTVTSAQKGGDLTVTVPAGATLQLVGSNTLHYPKAIQRKYQADTQGTTPFDRIPDNSVNGVTSNPILTELTGVTLPSTAGFNLDGDGLEPGFLHYGYVLPQFKVVAAAPAPVNLPPAIPGQEITIRRTESGSFAVLNPTDPENNVPISLAINQLPPFCSYNNSTRIITCQTDANTPVRSTFTITPTDSKGLAGTPGTFIVNVIDGNRPPVLPGQEITIVRGSSKAFEQYNGTDPENNVPLTYATRDLPGFCSANQDRVINCVTNATTPVRSEFFITPTDSLGAVGQPALFIVNVIEPGLGLHKDCVVKSTNTPCQTSTVNPGDVVIYTLTASNTGAADATEVAITDNVPNAYLQKISNVSDNGKISDIVKPDTTDIDWALGTLAPKAEKKVTFEATLKDTAKAGDIVKNVATIRAKDLKPVTVENKFPVAGPQGTPGSLESSKTCVRLGTSIDCAKADLKPGSAVLYTVRTKNTSSSSLSNVKIVDDYNQQYIKDIREISSNGKDSGDKITWTLGNLDAGKEVAVTFTATVKNEVTSGTIIKNLAVVSADGIPDQTVRADFTINIPVVANETPRSGALAIGLLGLSGATGGFGYFFWKRSHEGKANAEFASNKKKNWFTRLIETRFKK
jgi:uncharacterized repeat protein (TIGR01451 family)/fimbrial isopeptide formation D2 family protein